MLLIIFIFLLFTFYSVVIIFYNRSWHQMPQFTSGAITNTTFSIIIPARNEAANIGNLLQSLQSQSYPKELFEVIVVDDHSTDETVNVVRTFASLLQGVEVRIIELKSGIINSYKKKAIESGIAAAKNEWIVCTDADCIVPEKWLESFAALISQKQPAFIAAPVSLASAPLSQQAVVERHQNYSLLYIFQALDFMTLQGITAASVYKKVHSMCNGANLAYKKNIFYEVGGFKGVDDIASGDDMLLMYKIWKRYPDKVEYLKSNEAIVETEAAPTWKAFFNQRIRWASKAKHYDDKRIFAVLILVYLFNLSFLVLFVASFFSVKYLYALLFLWLAKTIIEYPFITVVSRFFNQQKLLKYFFFFQPLHIAYTIISGFLGSFGKYEWKGRMVK